MLVMMMVMMVFYLSFSIRRGEAGAGYPRSEERGLRCPLRPLYCQTDSGGAGGAKPGTL